MQAKKRGENMDLEKRVEKKTTAKVDQTLEQLSDGEITINQARIGLGLSPINDELANEKITTVLSYSNKESG